MSNRQSYEQVQLGTEYNTSAVPITYAISMTPDPTIDQLRSQVEDLRNEVATLRENTEGTEMHARSGPMLLGALDQIPSIEQYDTFIRRQEVIDAVERLDYKMLVRELIPGHIGSMVEITDMRAKAYEHAILFEIIHNRFLLLATLVVYSGLAYCFIQVGVSYRTSIGNFTMSGNLTLTQNPSVEDTSYGNLIYAALFIMTVPIVPLLSSFIVFPDIVQKHKRDFDFLRNLSMMLKTLNRNI